MHDSHVLSNNFVFSEIPAYITYVITVNASSYSLASIEAALTNLDILPNLQTVLRGITSVSIPTFVDLSPRSVASEPSPGPTRIPTVFRTGVNTGYLHIAQVCGYDFVCVMLSCSLFCYL